MTTTDTQLSSRQPTQSDATLSGGDCKDATTVIIVQLSGADDASDPRNWPLWRKVSISVAVIVSALSVMADGTLFTTAHAAIAEEFSVDERTFPHLYWPLTTWGIGAALFAMLVLPLAEDFSTYYVFLSSWLAMIVFIVPQAVARNYATIVVTRFFVGCFVAVIANVAVTFLISLWRDKRTASMLLGTWMTMFYVGVSLGPVIGGAIISRGLSWRWTFYVQLIWYAAMLPFLAVILKEVRLPVIHLATAKRLRKQGVKAFTVAEAEAQALAVPAVSPHASVARTLRRPFKMFFCEAFVLITSLYAAFLMGIVYLFTQSVEQVFVATYGFTIVQAGYVQAAIVIGELFGLLGVWANNRLYFTRTVVDDDGVRQRIPEVRLYTAVPGGALLIVGMFVYAWTSVPSVAWPVPALGLALTGCGVVVIANGLVDFLVDAYTLYAGSAMAAMAFGENITLAFLPLAAPALYTNLGFQWASSLLAFVSLVLTSMTVVLIVYGDRIRRRSPFIAQAKAELQALDGHPSIV